MIDLSEIPFVQARHFLAADRTAVDLVVIHSAEVAEREGVAAAVARRFAITDREASAHYVVDDQAIIQCVRETDVAFHAPGANRNGIGIELAGRADQSAIEWADPYSVEVLRNAAALVADLCEHWGIPAIALRATDLVSAQITNPRPRGITTHAAVSEAFRKSDHTDPGAGFPMGVFIELVREALVAGAAPAVAGEP